MHIGGTRMAHFCLILSTKASPPSLRAWDRKSHECYTSTWIAARAYPGHFVLAIEVLIVMECCVIGQAIVTRFEKKADVTSRGKQPERTK
jgi:hypothetical protein